MLGDFNGLVKRVDGDKEMDGTFAFVTGCFKTRKAVKKGRYEIGSVI